MSAPRIKDASFIQLHIEKLILAAGLLVLVIAVVLFVMGNPFAIEVNRQTYDKPAEAVDVLVRIDDELERGLQASKPLPPVITPKFQEDFMAMMQLPVDLSKSVAGLGNRGLTPGAVYPDIPVPPRYALVYPPAPKNVTFKSGTDVLDKEFDPKVTKAFFTMWGKELDEPGDFTMFIASGEFDISAWVERLKADAKSQEAIKIPAGIWAQRLGIAGVALLREEWDPEQGLWVNRQIVKPLPGQSRFLPSDKAESETTQAVATISAIRDAQLDLAQPELPWLTDFVQAVPPGAEGQGGGADSFLQQLDDQNFGKSEKEIIKLQEKIKQLEAQKARRQGRPAGGAGGTTPDDFSGDFEGPTGPTSERRDPIDRQIDNLRQRIEKLRPQAEKEAENRLRMAELQRQRDEERRRREALQNERDRALGATDGGIDGLSGIEGFNLAEGATIRVWAADPSMQPGKTYRYKLLVSVINPLYAVPRLAPDQLEENENRAALLPTDAEIDAMPWMGPVKVEPESRFFFTTGRENSARVEIYRRYEGKLRVQDFDASPGDRLGTVMETQNQLGQPMPIDMGIDAILVDVEKRRDVFTNSSVNTMIYADSQGNIYERIDVIDKSSPARKELREEIEKGPEQVLRPDPNATPGSEFDPSEFGAGGFESF